MIHSCAGIKQSGKLSNDFLITRPQAEDYYKTRTIPGLWQNMWRPIQFVLVMKEFDMEYVGEEHILHLAFIL